MPDIADRAQESETAEREAAIAAFRDRPKPAGESAYFCASCGDRIPDDRRNAVTTDLCAFCATQIDKGGR